MPIIQGNALSGKLNAILHEDPDLSPYALKVRVYDDGTAQIQGIVDVLEEKRQAEQLIIAVPGVKRVENNITVCTDGAIDDQDVAYEISEELQANPEVPDSVGVKVYGGEAQLVGSVTNRAEAQEAVETAGKARGVREIHNQLRLSTELEDVGITNMVQITLRQQPDLSSGRIKTLTNDGVVTLWGNVPEEQAIIAMEIAANIPGVRGVRNGFTKEAVELDDQIVIMATDMMADNPYLNEMPIQIEVADGRIIVSGSVDSLEGKEDLDKIIRRIITQVEPVSYNIDNQVRLVDKI